MKSGTFNTRPSPRELHRRLGEAKGAVRARSVRFANVTKAMGELAALPIGGADQVWELIGQLLEEIDEGHYAGSRPPMKSYEPKISGREIFAFCWTSRRMKRRMYLKFCILEGRFYYISLHESKRI